MHGLLSTETKNAILKICCLSDIDSCHMELKQLSNNSREWIDTVQSTQLYGRVPLGSPLHLWPHVLLSSSCRQTKHWKSRRRTSGRGRRSSCEITVVEGQHVNKGHRNWNVSFRRFDALACFPERSRNRFLSQSNKGVKQLCNQRCSEIRSGESEGVTFS